MPRKQPQIKRKTPKLACCHFSHPARNAFSRRATHYLQPSATLSPLSQWAFLRLVQLLSYLESTKVLCYVKQSRNYN